MTQWPHVGADADTVSVSGTRSLSSTGMDYPDSPHTDLGRISLLPPGISTTIELSQHWLSQVLPGSGQLQSTGIRILARMVGNTSTSVRHLYS